MLGQWIKTAHRRRFRLIIMCFALISSLYSLSFSTNAHALEPGDIVFADSGGIWTGFGYRHKKKQFGVGVGHAGIYIGKKDGVDTVIHCACFCGVAEVSLKNFPGYGTYKGARTTYPAPTPEQRQKIVEYAKQQVGKEYGRLPWRKKGPDSFNCSGFIEAVYEHAGLDLTPWWCGDLPYRYIWPLEQFNSPNVQCVDYGYGPVISGPKAMLMRLWMTYGYTFLWLCFTLAILSYRRHTKSRKLKIQPTFSNGK